MIYCTFSLKISAEEKHSVMIGAHLSQCDENLQRCESENLLEWTGCLELFLNLCDKNKPCVCKLYTEA